MKLSEINKIIKSEISDSSQDLTIKELATDSRLVMRAKEELFVAIKGLHRDGHSFIQDAYNKGIRSFLVSEDQKASEFPKAIFLKVEDTLVALQNLAAAKRKAFDYPVIGITGSNGKTVVKEWLFQLLAPIYKVIRSPKSYNSQIGVPLSVWKMGKEHNLGIFEAGISQPGEMENLEKIIRPNIGIFTNIGDAHSEGFLNMRQKIREKLLLFRHASTLIYCKDFHELNENIVDYRNQIRNSEDEDLKLFTWSLKTDATLKIISIEHLGSQTELSAIYKEKEVKTVIPFQDEASVENAIHCWCVLLLLQVDESRIAQNMASLQPVAMRLQLVRGLNNCTVINDTYNSDLTSLKIALDFLSRQKQHHKKTIILSDLFQTSKSDNELYEEIAGAVAQKNVHRVIGIGTAISKHKTAFRAHKNVRSVFFKSTEDFLKKLHLITFENEAILIKGARAFKFERIEKLLEQKTHATALEINLTAIGNNLKVYRSQLPAGVKVMAMVKAFSYGSGSYEIANLLQYSGVDYLAVAYADEGVSLRRAGINLPIMVMNPEVASFARMISWKLEPELFSLSSFDQFKDMAQTLGVSDYPVHIKLDTGMHRLGFVESELSALTQALRQSDVLKVVSVFSHLAGADDPKLDTFTDSQAALFEKMSSEIQAALGYRPLRHLLNSAGITRHKNYHYDMVRLGIGLYGIDSSDTIQEHLQNVACLKTTIAQIKDLPAGESIGYGRTGILERSSKIATVSIGYADGYFRDFGNGKGYMLVKDREAPVVGSVCMDMCMLDVTDIKGVAVGDEVVVFGPQLPITALAKWANTIPYEVMTSVSQRVNRIYINE